MSFEHLCKLVFSNMTKLKNKKNTFIYLRYEYNVFKIKKQKLKLGKVIFEIKQYIVAEIPVFEKLEMIYSKQDNTEEDEKNIENILKDIDWKWDFSNIGAFTIIFLFIAASCLSRLYNLYCDYFPSFAFRRTELDILMRFSFECLYSKPIVLKLRMIQEPAWLHDVLSDFIIMFNFL